MKRTRKIKITTYRRTVSLQQTMLRTHCIDCCREVETLSAACAAAVLEVDAQAFAQLIANGRIHAIHTISGSLLICRDSLVPQRGQ
jgi:hypothetical protein